MDETAQSDWLDEGAVQLALPAPYLSRWRGIDSADYERACAASDVWLGHLKVGDQTALVLGGDPSMLRPSQGGDGAACIVRWVFGENEEDLLRFALAGESVQRTEPDFLFDNMHSTWCIFDAASAAHMHFFKSVELLMPLGQVRVTTHYAENERNAVIVHRFLPCA